MSHYPELTEILNNPDKENLLVVRKSLWSQSYTICLLILSCGVFMLEFKHIHYFYPIPVLLLLEVIRTQYNDLYVIAHDCITHYRGRLSLAYNITVVKFIDIRAINVYQTFWQRIFNFGDIAIGTAAQSGNEMYILGVNDPKTLAFLIDSFKSNKSNNII